MENLRAIEKAMDGMLKAGLKKGARLPTSRPQPFQQPCRAGILEKSKQRADRFPTCSAIDSITTANNSSHNIIKIISAYKLLKNMNQEQ